MGAFDDLIPQAPSSAPLPAPSGGGLFDDLIPPLPEPSMTEGLVRETAKGVPIVGGAVNKLEAATNALLAPVIDPLLPDSFEKLPERTFGERYQHALDIQNRKDQAFEETHPVASGAAQVAGGVASMVPAASTTLGARLLGLTGSTLPGIATRSALANAGLSAADAALRGNDVGESAELGGITGAALPIIGRVVGNAVQGARNLIRGPQTTVPQNLVRVGNVDVPISGGQATADQATQMMEQNALRGGEGQAPQRVANQFFNEEQAPAIERARAGIQQGLDRFGQTLAENPQEAAEVASNAVRNIEQASRQNYRNLYDTALSMPGEFHAATFEGIGQKIKGDLTLSNNPVIIDDVTTPVASRAIQDIDNTISRLRIQNRADPFGPPNPENIVGVNLQGVDQVRKRLVAMAQATDRGGTDRRAMSRIIGAFDNHVEDAMTNGLFTGDDRALDAIRDARAAYAQHQQLFKSQGAGDDVGRTMEKIVGRNGGDGATPTEVANFLYGQAKVGGTGLAVRLAQRMQNVLGADSPEWAAIRQGLWSRLSEATEGTTAFGSQKSNNRISEFLNGSGRPLSQIMFSGQERDLMNRFAGLQRQITPLPGTVNYSNTAPVLRMIAANTLKGLSVLLGDYAAGPVGALAGYGANTAVRSMGERSAAGRVARSLYRTPAQNAADATFANQMARYGAVASRALVGPLDQKQAVNQ